MTCLYATASGESPLCGCRALSISHSITPAAYTSVRESVMPPVTCSGAMYATVPMIRPDRVFPAAACALASPKSTTLTRPSAVSSTFSGLTSRCTIPASCAADSPASVGSMTSSASLQGSQPRSRSRLRSVRPGTYSIDRYRNCPSEPWSKTCTMLGWDSRATDLASPMNLATKSASRASSACITLSATCRSSRVSVARYTVAMPPCAMRERTWYRRSSIRPISASARTDSITGDFTSSGARDGW